MTAFRPNIPVKVGIAASLASFVVSLLVVTLFMRKRERSAGANGDANKA
jgi:hypothetical protein